MKLYVIILFYSVSAENIQKSYTLKESEKQSHIICRKNWNLGHVLFDFLKDLVFLKKILTFSNNLRFQGVHSVQPKLD